MGMLYIGDKLASPAITVYKDSKKILGLSIDEIVAEDINTPGKLIKSSDSSFRCTATDIGDFALDYYNYSNSYLVTAEFPELTTISGNYALRNAFYSNTNMTSIQFPLLREITGEYVMYGMCQRNTSLTSVNFENLESISGTRALESAFRSSGLISVEFTKLSSITSEDTLHYCFNSCTSLTSLSFPALTSNSFGTSITQFRQMLYNVEGCTVHFPSNLQSVIEGLEGASDGFGGIDAILSYDLTATE